MKRIWKLTVCILLISVMAMIFTACTEESVMEEEVDSVTDDGFDFIIINQFDNNKTVIDTYAKIVGYSGENVNPDIPAKVNDIPVKVIASLAFFESEIKLINVPEGVEIIEGFAFGYAKDLGAIEIPSTIKEIGQYAFINCVALKYVTIKATERPTLGKEAFKFYHKDQKSYQISSMLKIKVPSIQAYTTTDVHDSWIEYADNLAEGA